MRTDISSEIDSSSVFPPWVRDLVDQLNMIRRDVRTILQSVTEHGQVQEQHGQMLGQLLQNASQLDSRVSGQTKDFYTVAEVARHTNRSEDTVRRWINQGKLPATRVEGTGSRGRLLIASQSLQDLVQAGLGEELPALAVAAQRDLAA